MTTSIPCRVLPFEEWGKMPRLRDHTGRVRRGDLVAIRSRGFWRLARITTVGRERIYTEYTTESALRENPAHPTVTRKSFRKDDDWLRYAGRDER